MSGITLRATSSPDRDTIIAGLSESDVQAIYRSIGVDRFGSGGAGNWLVHSPLREDRNPSFSIRRSDGYWHDFATSDHGTIFDALMEAHGYTFSEALEHVASHTGQASTPQPVTVASSTERREVARYSYCDEHGEILYETIRFDPKGFQQRRLNDAGKWVYRDALKDVHRVPYRLQAITRADLKKCRVLFEGEKDADRAAELGLLATATVGGSNAWRDEYAAFFQHVPVAIIPDNDTPGWGYAQAAAQSLHGIASSVRVVELPRLGERLPKHGLDFTDWLDRFGGSADELKQLIRSTEEWDPAFAPAVEPLPKAGLVFVTMSDVESRPVDWLWHGWLPRGKVTILGGHPGDGKSTMTAWLAATLSHGGHWPDGSPAPSARTLFLLAEDSLEDTLRPRLDQHGADVSRIIALSTAIDDKGRHESFDVKKHLTLLEAAITERTVDLIVIDPLTSFMPKSDRNAEGDVRDLLTPLGRLADRTGVAILAIMHVGKPSMSRRTPLQSLLGATAFGAVARSVWMIAPIQDDSGHRVVAVVKSNLALKPAPIEWSRPENAPIEWHGETTHDIEDLLSASSPKKQSPERLQIIALLKGSDSPLQAQAIAQRLSRNPSTTRTLLRRMVDDNLIEQPAYGVYAIRGSTPVDTVDNVDNQETEYEQESMLSTVSTRLPVTPESTRTIERSPVRMCADCGKPCGTARLCSPCAAAATPTRA